MSEATYALMRDPTTICESDGPPEGCETNGFSPDSHAQVGDRLRLSGPND